ncbi:hypothetical protein LUX33_43155 [Actinomadura madurae]|uniref:hypothetical protein n=1 Tax=Actinomadura madurae TaxID=1993 RepID=UPI0020D24F50|nr:hypothetical protein [Actinomadura madurae]MCP9954531.1 hypothetical protein [Actinomadura madurae]MCP9971272.1 hypothetical protein [Actinomadura madurae]
MTVSAHPLPGRARAAHGGPGRLRLAVCAATIAACVPYLTIKIAWLSGGTVGWNDASAAEDTALYAGNAITMGMDAVAVLVAMAFTFPWGGACRAGWCWRRSGSRPGCSRRSSSPSRWGRSCRRCSPRSR